MWPPYNFGIFLTFCFSNWNSITMDELEIVVFYLGAKCRRKANGSWRWFWEWSKNADFKFDNSVEYGSEFSCGETSLYMICINLHRVSKEFFKFELVWLHASWSHWFFLCRSHPPLSTWNLSCISILTDRFLQNLYESYIWENNNFTFFNVLHMISIHFMFNAYFVNMCTKTKTCFCKLPMNRCG